MTSERLENRAAARKRPQDRQARKFVHDWQMLVAFIIPAFVIVVLVQFYPLAYSVWLSTQNWNLTESQTSLGFVGFGNFIATLQHDVFQRAVQNSAIITGSAIVVEMLLGTLLAYLTIGSNWRMRVIRTILILPMVIAPVAAGTLWRMILNTRAGLANYMLGAIGIKGPEWLASPDWAMVSVIMLDVWQWTPFVLLVVSAALTSVPHELIEAAAIDGASRWQIIFKIEIPLMLPLLVLTLMLRTLDSLLSLDSIYSLTFGGPGYSTYTLTYYIYNVGLKNFDFGAAAAASWLFMGFAGILIAIAFWFQRREQTA